MSCKIIDGRDASAKTDAFLREEIGKLPVRPSLHILSIGEEPEFALYRRTLEKKCRNLGIESVSHMLARTVGEDELISFTQSLNKDRQVQAVLMQAPLPSSMDFLKVAGSLHPDKDADGINPLNFGMLAWNACPAPPGTPAGIMELIRLALPNPVGREAVIIGRSMTVGKPLAMMLINSGATVTICHSSTVNLKKVASKADILVAAAGKAEFITAEYIKEGAVVIDVGINTLQGRLTGDIHFKDALKKAGWITPVPGGVGPMTVSMLMRNVVNLTKKQLAGGIGK